MTNVRVSVSKILEYFQRITRHHQPYNNCIQPNILLKFIQYIIYLINLDFIYLYTFYGLDEFICWWLAKLEKEGNCLKIWNIRLMAKKKQAGSIVGNRDWNLDIFLVEIFGSTRHFRRILFSKVDQRVGGVKLISENSCSSFGLFSELGNCAAFRTLCVSVRGRLCTRGRLFEFRRICANCLYCRSSTASVVPRCFRSGRPNTLFSFHRKLTDESGWRIIAFGLMVSFSSILPTTMWWWFCWVWYDSKLDRARKCFWLETFERLLTVDCSPG